MKGKVTVQVIPESEAPRPLSGVAAEVHRALSSIQPGQVVRITPDAGRGAQGTGSALSRYAKKSPYRVEFWCVEGVYYVKRLPTLGPEAKPEPLKLPAPGRCPRCSGNLVRSRELDGVMVKCLACGFEPSETPEEAGITVTPGSRAPRLNGARA